MGGFVQLKIDRLTQLSLQLQRLGFGLGAGRPTRLWLHSLCTDCHSLRLGVVRLCRRVGHRGHQGLLLLPPVTYYAGSSAQHCTVQYTVGPSTHSTLPHDQLAAARRRGNCQPIRLEAALSSPPTSLLSSGTQMDSVNPLGCSLTESLSAPLGWHPTSGHLVTSSQPKTLKPKPQNRGFVRLRQCQPGGGSFLLSF